MPPQLSPVDVEEASKLAAFLAAIIGLLVALYGVLRWPVRAAGKATHRFFGELAFADELARGKEMSAALVRMEPTVQQTARDVDELKADVRRIVDHLLERPPVRVPDHGLPTPPSPHRAAR